MPLRVPDNSQSVTGSLTRAQGAGAPVCVSVSPAGAAQPPGHSPPGAPRSWRTGHL